MLVRILARLRLFRPVERLLVRYTGYSLLSWQLSRRSGVPYIPTLMLTTAGRHSGARHATPLFYFMDGANYVLVASKGGAPAHPDWFVNIQANPRARVRVNRREILVGAEVAEGEERTRLWELVSTRWPVYHDYQERARPREIPVVVLRAASDQA